MNSTSPSRRSLAGYALLEALVAVIVTSIGFIGAARLQTLGMSFNSSAMYRQKATQLGYQMTDRMRANQVGLVGGVTANVRDGAYNLPTAGPTSCLTDSVGCTAEELSKADAAVWLADVSAQLPNGTGVVCVDSTPIDDPKATPADPKCDNLGNVLAVKVWWTDTLGENLFVTVTRP